MATTESKPLFDIPPEKRCEAFVRARFAQEDVFGLAGIETWLQWERAQARPNEVGWKPFLARDFTEMCAATMPLLHLQDRATRYTPFQRGTERSTAPFGRILPLFKDGFYWGYRDVGVYVHEPMKELFVLSETHGKLTIERIGDANVYVGAKAVVDVLFAEWNRQRPKWKEAREFLCNALAEEIKRERAKAEHDFDTAVAVSADGTKIVHADWVVVVEHGQHNRILSLSVYPGSSFRDRKIRCAEDRRNSRLLVGSYEDYDLAEMYNWSLAKQVGWMIRRTPTTCPPPYEQEYAVTRSLYAETVGKLPQASILITGGYFCPSPLPDGGVEVAV